MRSSAPSLSWACLGRDHIFRRGGKELARLIHVGKISGFERWRVGYAGAESSPLTLVPARRVAESVAAHASEVSMRRIVPCPIKSRSRSVRHRSGVEGNHPVTSSSDWSRVINELRAKIGWWLIATGFAILPRILRDQLAGALANGVTAEDAAVAAWIDQYPDSQTVN